MTTGVGSGNSSGSGDGGGGDSDDAHEPNASDAGAPLQHPWHGGQQGEGVVVPERRNTSELWWWPTVLPM